MADPVIVTLSNLVMKSRSSEPVSDFFQNLYMPYALAVMTVSDMETDQPSATITPSSNSGASMETEDMPTSTSLMTQPETVAS